MELIEIVSKHEWIEDKSVENIWDDIISIEVCKYCDCQLWTWIRMEKGVVKKYKYMLNHGTQYYAPEEKCLDPYKLRGLSKAKQLKLF